MKITRFEEVEAWKEARVLVSMVYESTGKEPFKKINYRHRLTLVGSAHITASPERA